jgi:formate hydrogenlyase transcriptional activator
MRIGPSKEPHTAVSRGVCADARADVYRTLLEVSRATASHRDLESLLRDLTGVLRRVAPFDVLRLVLHDAERDVMRLHTLAAVRPVVTTALETPTSESPSGVAWETQQKA